MRSLRSQRLLAIAATAYGMNAQASPRGTSTRSCGVNWALPNACTTEQGNVNVNTIFDTTSPGRFPNEPDRPAKYPATIIATNAATFIRMPSTAPPPQYKKRYFTSSKAIENAAGATIANTPPCDSSPCRHVIRQHATGLLADTQPIRSSACHCTVREHTVVLFTKMPP